MLKKLEQQDFDRYVDFAYELALDMTKSGYPTYADGIKTKSDFISRARAALSADNEEILLFERNGSVAGWIHYFYLPEDRYLDTSSFCIAEGMAEALAEFTAFARERFPGSTLYLGFPKENTEAVSALEASGFELIEESFNDVLDYNGYIPRPESGDIVPVTRENYQLFTELHSKYDEEMYWNSERILRVIENWRLFVLIRNEKPAGAVYFRIWEDKLLSEIFGIDFPGGVYDGEVFRTLLTAALNCDKRRGTRHMVFFNEDESQSDTLACGFRCVGRYVCFKKEL